jgi:regulatory protein
MPKQRPPAGKCPDSASLHEAALRHLARYAATEAGLRRVLHRRVDRWARAAAEEAEADAEDVAGRAAAAKALAGQEAARLVEAGIVDDAAYAQTKARGLARSGRSRQAIAAHLSVRGVNRETLQAALPDASDDIAAAVALARKRRLGPFATAQPDDEARRRAQSVLARAGFSREVALRALRMDRDAAEALIAELRRA